MRDTKQHEIAESLFDHKKQRESQANDALSQEDARRAAAVKNMQRLRSLRLARAQQDHQNKN
jgi:hypothetical protein